jgi:excisionase family DNA binding protein
VRQVRQVRQANGSEPLLTAEETAELLSVPKSWVYAETRAGRIPHLKLGRYYRYSRRSLEAFVAGLERGPTPYRRYAPGIEPGGSPDA